MDNVLAVSSGRIHCLALRGDGTVVQWVPDVRGEASFQNVTLTTGEIAVEDKAGTHIIHTNTATIVTNGVVRINGRILHDVISIAAGDEFSLGLKRDGTVISWGENSSPNAPSNVVAIAAASFRSLAVKNNGTVIEWVGVKWFPGRGQLNEVPDLSHVVAVAIGSTSQGTRNVALKDDGMVVRWGGGETIYHDQTPPAGLSNVVAIAAGKNHTLALKRDGTVIGWGFSEAGQATGVPTTNPPNVSAGQVTLGGQILSNVVSVAANDDYSMALKKDGTVVAWGKMVNNLYPATVPDGLSNVVAIAAGDSFCLAITTNKAVAERFQQQ
jgi:alpha-tubulin suppressor-like RCC1 family protein